LKFPEKIGVTVLDHMKDDYEALVKEARPGGKREVLF